VKGKLYEQPESLCILRDKDMWSQVSGLLRPRREEETRWVQTAGPHLTGNN